MSFPETSGEMGLLKLALDQILEEQRRQTRALEKLDNRQQEMAARLTRMEGQGLETRLIEVESDLRRLRSERDRRSGIVGAVEFLSRIGPLLITAGLVLFDFLLRKSNGDH